MEDYEITDFSTPNTEQSNPEVVPPKPENYLVWAILSTLCCCLPFGIVAIIKACKVNTLYAGKLYDAATMASQDAKKWCIIAAVTGLAINIIYGLFVAISGESLYDL